MTFQAFRDSESGRAAMLQCDMGHYWLALQIAFEAGQARVYAPAQADEPIRFEQEIQADWVPFVAPDASSLGQLRRIGT